MTTPDEARKLAENVMASPEEVFAALVSLAGQVEKAWNIVLRTNDELAEAKAEIDRLKQAAEDEFQKADGKAEMKRWFQEELVKVTAERDAARKHYETFKADAISVQKEMAKAIDEARDERDAAVEVVENIQSVLTDRGHWAEDFPSDKCKEHCPACECDEIAVKLAEKSV